MRENYLVTCGKWTTTESVDREVFETHEEACFEAATMSLEKYFKTSEVMVGVVPHTHFIKCTWSCLVRPAKMLNSNKNDYLIFPPKLYENIGLHVVTKYFKNNKQL